MKITIIRTRDGERRIVDAGIFTSRFWWEEGNGACDCNRHAAFEGGDSDFPCGRGAYDIELPEECA